MASFLSRLGLEDRKGFGGFFASSVFCENGQNRQRRGSQGHPLTILCTVEGKYLYSPRQVSFITRVAIPFEFQL